jgi:hypothetical protein
VNPITKQNEYIFIPQRSQHATYNVYKVRIIINRLSRTLIHENKTL